MVVFPSRQPTVMVTLPAPGARIAETGRSSLKASASTAVLSAGERSNRPSEVMIRNRYSRKVSPSFGGIRSIRYWPASRPAPVPRLNRGVTFASAYGSQLKSSATSQNSTPAPESSAGNSPEPVIESTLS